MTRPRASAGVVFLVFGVALVAGAIAAFTAAQAPATRGAEWMIGAAVLVLVLGVGTVVVALGRRRSGALAFFSILAVLALVLAVVVPTDRTTIMPGAAWGIDTSSDGRYAQLAGTTSLYVSDRDGDPVVVDLWQLAGTVQVDLQEGGTLRLEFTTDARDQWLNIQENFDSRSEITQRSSEYRLHDGRLRLTAGSGDPDVVLRLWAGAGTRVFVYRWSETGSPLELDPSPDYTWDMNDDGQVVEPTPAPTSTPAPTDSGVTSGEGGTP